MNHHRTFLQRVVAYLLTGLLLAASVYLMLYGYSVGIATTGLYRGMPAFWGGVAIVLLGILELVYFIAASNQVGGAPGPITAVARRFFQWGWPLGAAAALLVIARVAVFAPAIGLAMVPELLGPGDLATFGVGTACAVGFRVALPRLPSTARARHQA